mgnify:CR=1 FL=1
MKPYILNYSETIEIKSNIPISGTDMTSMTETVEQTDEDEITYALHCSTIVTKTIEPSDNDEINEMSTIVTRTIEPSDNDDIHQMSTFQTNTLESSDNDEILLN